MAAPTTDPSKLEGGLDAYIGGSQIAAGVSFLIVCTIFVALKFYTQAYISKVQFGIEDGVILAAWVLMVGYCANTIVGVTEGGIGRHEAYWLIKDPSIFVPYFKILFVEELIYAPTIALLKTSVLFLYLRLFSVRKWFRVATFGFLAYIWLWAIILTFIFIFMCNPVAKQWDQSLPGTCLDTVTIYKFHSIPNVVHDVGMIILPQPVIWRLKTDLRNKIALSSLFVLGTLGCIAGFIRLGIFWEADFFGDATWGSVRLYSWTLAEPGTICICACAPAIWPLVRSIFRVGTTARGSDREAGQYRRHRDFVSNDGPLGHDSLPLRAVHANDPSTSVFADGSKNQTVFTPARGITVTKDISWSVTSV